MTKTAMAEPRPQPRPSRDRHHAQIYIYIHTYIHTDNKGELRPGNSTNSCSVKTGGSELRPGPTRPRPLRSLSPPRARSRPVLDFGSFSRPRPPWLNRVRRLDRHGSSSSSNIYIHTYMCRKTGPWGYRDQHSLVVASAKNRWFLRPAVQYQLAKVVFEQ